MDVIIKLLEAGDKPVRVFAKKTSAGRNEESAAGVNGHKAAFVFEVWASEYNEQSELEWDGNIMTIYRTYGPKKNDKIELYTEMRRGRR